MGVRASLKGMGSISRRANRSPLFSTVAYDPE